MLCLFAAPLFFGGRHDLGRLAYAAFVATTALAWVLGRLSERRAPIRWSTIHTLFLLAFGLVSVQLAPLPPATLSLLSPALEELAPTWSSAAETPLKLGEWRTLSLTPSATRVGLAVLASHALLYLVVADRLRQPGRLRWLLTAIGAASAAMAVLGLTQWMTSNGKLLWFYPHPSRQIGAAVQGTFANKNHFAQFVALGLGPLLLLWWKARAAAGESAGQRLAARLWLAAAAISATAVLLSLSRGALAAVLLGLTMATVLTLKAKQVTRSNVLTAAGVAGLLIAAIAAVDYTPLTDRLETLTSGAVDELDRGGARRLIWSANADAIQANPWLGYGVGSHADVYPAFLSRGFRAEFTHAESGYLHTATETGLAGLLLLVFGLLSVGRWLLLALATERDPGRLTCWAALAVGLVASATHSVVDFVWYIPSCASVAVMLAAAALRLHQTRPNAATETAPTRHLLPRLTMGAAAAGACWTVATLLGPGSASLAWDRYLSASVQHRELVSGQLQQAAAASESSRQQLELLQHEMVDALETAVSRDPGNARAHLRLAGRKLQQFDLARRDSANAIGLVHIREAALASRFPSRDATVEWLQNAFGSDATQLIDAHWHTRRALALAPLQGDGYGYLADLGFLSPPSQRGVDTLMSQAVRIRPQDGGVLFEAGKQAWIAGDAEAAVAYWKQAHHLPGSHRLQIVAQLATRVPAADYLFKFEPDWGALYMMYQLIRDTCSRRDLEAIADYAAKLASQPDHDRHARVRNGRGWILASEIEQQLGRHGNAIAYAEQARSDLPDNYAARRRLSSALMADRRFDDAQPHLRWLLSRRPSDRTVQDWLKLTKLPPPLVDAAGEKIVR